MKIVGGRTYGRHGGPTRGHRNTRGVSAVDYKITFVTDGRMPDGHDFMLCKSGEGCVLYFRESFRSLPAAAMARVMESAWAGFRGALLLDRLTFVDLDTLDVEVLHPLR